jgi:hypothetical protein
MTTTIFTLLSTFALTTPNTTLAQPTNPTENGCWWGCGGGIEIGIDIGGGGDDDDGGVDVDVDLGDCLDVDIEAGASCGILAGLDFYAECDPLSVEAACIAELGADCGLEAFAACTAELTAHCQAELEADGALFCDGHFIGGGGCLDEIDVDVDIDLLECVDLDVDVDVDVDLDLCLNLELDLDVEVGAECLVACDPIAVEAWCYAELGDDCSLDEFAACQAEVIAECQAGCEAEGSVFCDGGVYAGLDLCLDLGIEIGTLIDL